MRGCWKRERDAGLWRSRGLDRQLGARVGITANRPIDDGTGQRSIEYFIPLDGLSGTYGTGGWTGWHHHSGCQLGFGTCADSGYGGGVLTMILRFTPVSNSDPSVLNVIFEDLDLANANDPGGFLERLNVVTATGDSLTGGWVTDINQTITNGTVGGDANQQFLSLLLGVVTTDPLYLELQFKVPHQHQRGTNTPEYLIAWIDNTPVVVPIPPAFLLLGTALAGVGAYSRRQRRKAAGNAVAENR